MQESAEEKKTISERWGAAFTHPLIVIPVVFVAGGTFMYTVISFLLSNGQFKDYVDKSTYENLQITNQKNIEQIEILKDSLMKCDSLGNNHVSESPSTVQENFNGDNIGRDKVINK